MTDIGKRLLNNLPPKINRNGEIISSLIANKNKSGAIEKMFLYGDTVKDKYSKADNVYKMDSELIDQTMKVFSFFERFYEESDESFTKRNKSIFVRNGDVTWGTTWNIKHVFEYYFPKAKIFLVENIGRWTENILINSGFESNVPEEIEKWTYSGCEINSRGAFAGSKGILFTQDDGAVSQTVSIEEGAFYFVTCAVSGNVVVSVKDTNGNHKRLYSVGEVIGKDGSDTKISKSKDWEIVQYFFYSDKQESVSITVTGEKDAKVDLITLDKKKNYPCFTVYVWFDGIIVGNKTLHLSQKGEDPISGINYDKESYFGNTFFSGVVGKSFAAEIYQDILNMVKAAGTKADLMLLIKETGL